MANLKLIAAQIVVESSMSKLAKLQLLNFIKEEASNAQIKALLMDGKIVNLDEQAEQIVNERFEISEAGGRVAKLRKTYSSLAGASAGLGVWALYRAIRGGFDNCTKKCGTFEYNTSRRQHCMIQCKLNKAKADLDAATKSKDAKQIMKKKMAFEKAQQIFEKSKRSFTSRGTDV